MLIPSRENNFLRKTNGSSLPQVVMKPQQLSANARRMGLFGALRTPFKAVLHNKLFQLSLAFMGSSCVLHSFDLNLNSFLIPMTKGSNLGIGLSSGEIIGHALLLVLQCGLRSLQGSSRDSPAWAMLLLRLSNRVRLGESSVQGRYRPSPKN